VIQACVRWRGATVLATLAILVASIVGFGRVQQQFFPLSERPELFFQLRLPEGSAIGTTVEAVRRAEHLLRDVADIATYTAYVGQGSPRFWLGLNPQLPNEAFAEIVIVAKDVAARERLKARIEGAVAQGALAEARVRVDRFNFGPPVGFPVQFRVVGPDPIKVRAIATEVRDRMWENRNVVEPHLDWNEMTPSVRVVVDQERARSAGPGPGDHLAVAAAASLRRAGHDRPRRHGKGRGGRQGAFQRTGRTRPCRRSHSHLAERCPGAPLAGRRLVYDHEEPILWRRNRDMAITVRADVVDGVQPPDVTGQIWPNLKPIQDSSNPPTASRSAARWRNRPRRTPRCSRCFR
jgi:multidrug efflux pump subunit AcrB